MLNGRWPHSLSTLNWVRNAKVIRDPLVGAFSVITNLRIAFVWSTADQVYVLGIPQLECNTWKFPCISIILWATQVAICQLKKPGTLGRTEENSVSQKSDLWFLLGVNQCGNNLRGFPNIELHVPSLVLVLTVWIEVSITSYKLFCLEKSNCSNLWSYFHWYRRYIL